MARIPGRKIARRLLRPLARTLFPGAVVIAYHRVANADWDPLDLAVSPENFAEQLEVLSQLRELLSVSELAARQAARRNLEPYAAVAFDDGYSDFAETALPILEERDVPATVFVATGFVGGQFWWDEIAALLATAHAPVLEITQPRTRPIRYAGLERRERRVAAAHALCRTLQNFGRTEIEAVIAELRAWSGCEHAPRPDYGPMSSAELASLGRHALVEIGAHTVDHAPLRLLPHGTQRAQIEQSKVVLASLTGREVTAFSYPHGSYSSATPRLVRALGFSCACGSRPGTFGRRTDPYRIPRLWAPDVSGAAFRRWLGDWIAEAR